MQSGSHWAREILPVLREVARWNETSGPSAALRDEELADRLGRRRSDPAYLSTLRTLIGEGYLEGQELKTMTSYGAVIRGLKSKGYQALGEWPSGDGIAVVEAKKQMRAAFMNQLYDVTSGSRTSSADMHELGAEAGLSRSDAEEVGRYLEDEGLITFVSQSGLGGSVALTHQGVLEVERGREAPTSPTEHFPPYQNIIHFHGSVSGAQIQQASPGAQQEGTFSLSAEAIRSTVREIREALGAVQMDDTEREMIDRSLSDAENNAERTDPAGRRVVRAALGAVGSVIEGMVATGGYAELAHLLPLPH